MYFLKYSHIFFNYFLIILSWSFSIFSNNQILNLLNLFSRFTFYFSYLLLLIFCTFVPSTQFLSFLNIYFLIFSNFNWLWCVTVFNEVWRWQSNCVSVQGTTSNWKSEINLLIILCSRKLLDWCPWSGTFLIS